MTPINVLATATTDTTFGTNGTASITLGDSPRIAALAVQNNDKIVVVGDIQNGNSGRDGVVVRYNANGTLDQSFGSGGKVVLSVTPRDDMFYAAAIQTDGKIVVVGSVSPTADSSNTDFLIVRFNENGSLDSNFIGGGVITANQGSQDSLRAVKIQPDGKIVAVGGTSDSGGRGAVVRLTPNGLYDTSFGGGIVFVDRPFNVAEMFTSLDFYTNNRILIGGEADSGAGGPGSRNGFITLLEPNGTIVQDFGNGGFVTGISLGLNIKTKVKVLPNGKFAVGEDRLLIYTGGGLQESSLLTWNITGLALLSQGNIVTMSRPNTGGTLRGVRVYSPNFRLIGSDEKDISAGGLAGNDVAVDSKDKIIILRDSEIVRLDGITSNATRVIHFDEDTKTDIAVYRPGNYTFYALRSSDLFSPQTFAVTAPLPIQQRRVFAENYVTGYNPNNVPRSEFAWFDYQTNSASPTVFGINSQTAIQWGASGDVPVGGDYDGDGLTDFTVFRPANGVWYILQSSNNQFRAVAFGQSGDKLVPADYDYDGITDFAVFRPSNGAWYISRSSDGGFYGIAFGANGDVPTAGDYDGDGRADFTVFRPANGTWYSLKSRAGFSAVAFGASGDQPVPGDYDGDGRHDAAVFRAGIWYLLQSRDGFRAVQWGLPSDVPITVRY